MVSAADFERWFLRDEAIRPLPVPLARDATPERRTARADRRRATHDRRWEQARGRRFRLADRRQL